MLLFPRRFNVTLELWTSGEIADDVSLYLAQEQSKRTKNTISWRSGKDVLALAVAGKKKSTAALKQLFSIIRCPKFRFILSMRSCQEKC